MPHRVDLYLRLEGPLHRVDPRAKLLAVGGLSVAVLLAPLVPAWSLGSLGLLVVGSITAARVPCRPLLRRLLPLTTVIGLPFLLSRIGGDATRAAGVEFAVKSLLVATAFLVLLACTRASDLLEIVARLPLIGRAGQLGEFILRGTEMLVEEVMRTNRAWALRAPHAALRARVTGLGRTSVSLVARAAARSERIGAALALRGFRGAFPVPPPAPLPGRQLAAGAAYALAALALSGIARWL